MSDAEDKSSITKRRLRQNKELLRMQAEIVGISKKGDKSDVLAFLSDHFDSNPIMKGNTLFVGPVMCAFDDDDNFLEISEINEQNR